MDYFIGIDAGGTHCRASLFNQAGDTLGVGSANAANVFTNFAMAMQQIDIAIDAAIDNALTNALNNELMYTQSDRINASLLHIEKSELIVGAGCAGGHTSKAEQLLRDWKHPYKHFFMTSDLHASCLAANKGEDCVVIITGTGSSIAHFQHGKLTQYGGHGFIHGDDASGAWLGLNGVQLLLKSYDGLLKDDVFCEAILKAINCNNVNQVLNHFTQKNAKDYAAIAPDILALCRDGNITATTLVNEGLEYLASILVKNKLVDSSSIFITGGLAESYKVGLSEKIGHRVDTMDSLAQVGAFLHAQNEYQLY